MPRHLLGPCLVDRDRPDTPVDDDGISGSVLSPARVRTYDEAVM